MYLPLALSRMPSLAWHWVYWWETVENAKHWSQCTCNRGATVHSWWICLIFEHMPNIQDVTPVRVPASIAALTLNLAHEKINWSVWCSKEPKLIFVFEAMPGAHEECCKLDFHKNTATHYCRHGTSSHKKVRKLLSWHTMVEKKTVEQEKYEHMPRKSQTHITNREKERKRERKTMSTAPQTLHDRAQIVKEMEHIKPIQVMATWIPFCEEASHTSL